jgi:hypothetical protein
VRPRFGTVAAFGVGYVLGTRAGRERYLQVVRAFGVLRRSPPVSGTTELLAAKSKAIAFLGVERLKDTVGVRLGWRNGDQAADAIAVDLAEDLAGALNHRRDRLTPQYPHPRHRRQMPALAHASSR